MVTIGIDPGLKGAIAAYDGTRIRTFDIPTHTVKRGKTYKDRLDSLAVLRIARLLSQLKPDCVAIEDVGGMPRQSASGAFTFGFATGEIAMAFKSCGLAVHPVAPVTWKAQFKLKGSKDDSRALASRLFPNSADQWPRAGHDGRAEAALIALYAARVLVAARHS